MELPPPMSAYVSRIVPLAPAHAAAAFDAWTNGPPDGLSVDETAPCSSDGWGPLRSVRGRLATGRWSRWPIEIELVAWSSHRTELGLRPHCRRSWPPDTYFRAAHVVADELALALELAALLVPDAEPVSSAEARTCSPARGS